MSYRLLITFVTLIISTQIVSGQNTESEQIHLEIASKILDEVRSVIIILPDSYTKSADKKYPLLILLDGAAHLEATFAAVNSDSTLESIIVAIENLDRERDFTVTKLQTRRENTMGGGWNFLSFLETEVIPKVNSEYKTSSQKMLIGHSLGGLLTLNAFMQEDSPFNAFVSIDPSIWWDEETMQKKVDNIESTCFTKKLFIATANQGEANLVRNKQRHDRFFSLIQQKANTPENSKLLYYEHENHRSIPSVAIKDGLTFLSINEQLTMRIKKIRGHKRLWRHIKQWRDANLPLDVEKLKTQHRDYVKIWILPFSSISVLNCEFPEPKGKTRQLILAGLVDIYHAWKTKLDALGEPYYLKIWLYEPHFSRSQVVCAIGSMLDFYDITFHKPDEIVPLKTANAQSTLPAGFNWELHFDELHIHESDIGEAEDYYSLEDYYAEQRWFAKKMRRPHRTSEYENRDGTKTVYYSFKTGNVWVGEANNE